MGPHNKDIRINWDDDPRHTTHMLDLIASNKQYRSSIFGNAGDRWIAERDLCIQVLKDQLWIKDAAEKGLVKKVGGKWEATSKWTSGFAHPVRNRLNMLTRRMDTGWYAEKHQLDPSWRSERDMPRSMMTSYTKAFPYYFTLRTLWEESKGPNPNAGASTMAGPASSSRSTGKRKADALDTSASNVPYTLVPGNAHVNDTSVLLQTTKRKGRPPGTSKRPSIEMGSSTVQMSAASLIGTEVSPHTAKQGRGRPSKFHGSDLLGPIPVHAHHTTEGSSIIRRGRGRPPGSSKKITPNQTPLHAARA